MISSRFITVILLTALSVVGLIPANAQSIKHISKVVAFDRAAYDHFGYKVSISGNYAIVGAIEEAEDENGGNTLAEAGAAYIFEKDANGNWIEVQKIVASDREAGDAFGFSVSISGNYAIVGAVREDNDVSGGNYMSRSGSAYIFERDGTGKWNEVQKIVAYDRAKDDIFGRVSISGNFAVVAARWEDEDKNGNNTLKRSGSAYIFERDTSGTWNTVQKIVASDRDTTSEFGYSVSIDGNYIIIGATWERHDATGANTLNIAGAAYIFEKDGTGQWNEIQKITASDRDVQDRFGFAASISGDRAIVSSFSDKDATGNNVINGSGAAYLFERSSNGTWSEVQKLVAPDREANSFFGRSVSIDNDYAVVGAYANSTNLLGNDSLYLAGAAYLFKRNTNGLWSGGQKFLGKYRSVRDEFGWSSSVSGNFIIVGGYYSSEDSAGGNILDSAGSADVYEIVENPVGIENNNFGDLMKVFPNPTNGVVTVDLGYKYDEVSVYIRNSLGQIQSGIYFEKRQKFDIEIEGSPGLYLVEIQTNNGRSAAVRILKE